MYVREVAELFGEYCSEPDHSFLTAAQTARYLKLAYDEFRALVLEQYPFAYMTSVTLTFADQREYDLSTGAVKIMGPPSSFTHTGLQRPVTLNSVKSNGLPHAYWAPVANFIELGSYGSAWMLVGQKLTLSRPYTGDLVLSYIGRSQVDWTLIDEGDNGFIDDFDEFHDLIALFAFKQYAFRDGDMDSSLVGQMQHRTEQFRSFLMARSQHGGQFVSMVDDSPADYDGEW